MALPAGRASHWGPGLTGTKPLCWPRQTRRPGSGTPSGSQRQVWRTWKPMLDPQRAWAQTGGRGAQPSTPPHPLTPPAAAQAAFVLLSLQKPPRGGPGGRGAGRGNKATEPRRAGLSPGGGGSSPGLPSPLLSALPHASVQMKEFEGTRKKYGSYFQNWNQLQLGIKHPHVSRSSGLWVPPTRGSREGARRSGPESEGGSTLAPVPVASSAHPEVTPCTPRAHTQCSHPVLTPRAHTRPRTLSPHSHLHSQPFGVLGGGPAAAP